MRQGTDGGDGRSPAAALAVVLAADQALRRRLDQLAGSRRILHREQLADLMGWIAGEGLAACAAYEQLLAAGTPELVAAMKSAARR